jgi:protein O-GlcNAc transferase
MLKSRMLKSMTRQHLPNVTSASQAPQVAAHDLLQQAANATRGGDFAKVAAHFKSFLSDYPTHRQAPDAWLGLATALKRIGSTDSAGEAYRNALALRPNAAAHFGLAEILRRQGHLTQALDECEKGLALDPAVGEGHIIRAMTRKNLRDPGGAIEDLQRVIQAHPNAALHGLLSDIFFDCGRLEESLACLDQAISKQSPDISLQEHRARIFMKQSRTAEAAGALEIVTKQKPRDAEAHRLLAIQYQELGRKAEAYAMFQKALCIHPGFSLAHTNFAALLMSDYQLDLAASHFRLAATLSPDSASAHYNLGVVNRLSGQTDESLENFQRARALDPNHAGALLEICFVRQGLSDWRGLREQQESLFNASFRQGKPVSPFAVISSMSSLEDQLGCARVWAKHLETKVTRKFSSPAPDTATRATKRLKIGYVSPDFHCHPIAMLIADLIETHDKARFDIKAYSFGPDDKSALRERLKTSFETFSDLRGTTPEAAARRIHDDKIDILINLKGYSQDADNDVFSYRPAPVQVNYLGYPGTMGADFIDYIIADSFIVPPEHTPFYTEKIVRLPHCYQPNDRKRAIAEPGPTRDDCGLPPDSLVFCCFNNTYKIGEEMFDIWMRLLHGVPGSVLWLLGNNQTIVDNLRREAVSRGISAERLVFAPRLAVSEHLSRMRLADLFLDTLPYNAHTTASEALWVGLPVLTCSGNTFAGRVAGSILNAIGLPELITDSLVDYEAKARELAHNCDMMTRLRNTLAANRIKAPLFDTERYVRNFEKALIQMARLHAAGRVPEAFDITA